MWERARWVIAAVALVLLAIGAAGVWAIASSQRASQHRAYCDDARSRAESDSLVLGLGPPSAANAEPREHAIKYLMPKGC